MPSAALAAELVLNEYNAVAGGEYLAGQSSDGFWGRREANGGDWFELVVVGDHLDLRGWKLRVTNDVGGVDEESFVLTLTDDDLWADLRSGTILTFSEELATNVTDYKPVFGRWWMNLRVHPNTSDDYVTVACVNPVCDPDDVAWKVSNLDWQLLITNAGGQAVFGPAGEAVKPFGAIGPDEVFKLEETPSASTTPLSNYNDGTSSSFGQPNLYSAGTVTQDLSALRDSAPYSALSSVRINEVYSHSDPGIDWFELHNPGTEAVDVSGWYLSDNPDNLTEYQIADGTIIDAGGYLTFDETDVPFAFSSSCGDELILSVADAGGLSGERDFVEFGPVETGVPYGRVSELNTGITRLSGPTRGWANEGTLVGPIIINEIMYHPPEPGPGIDVDTEFIELHNAGDSPVDLYTDFGNYGTHPWKLRGGIGFEFPIGTTMAADSYLLIVNFDPSSGSLRSEFETVYGLDGATTILGPYSGQLNNFTDTIRLRKPDSPNPLGNNCGSSTSAGEYAPRVVVEEVSYFDFGDWPSSADGDGASLERVDPDFLAALPSSWSANLAGSATPGRANSTLTPPTVAQAKCINALNKDFSKVAKTQGKLDYGCAKNAAKGKLDGMTADQCLTDDPRGKLASIQAKTSRDFTRSCSGQDRDGNSVYPLFGASDAATANAAAISAPIALMGDVFGDSLDGALVSADSERDMSKCQLAVTKTIHKCLDTTLGIFNKCKKEGLKDGEMRRTRDLAECVGKDNRGKIAKVCSATTGKIARDLERKCEGKGVDFSQALPGCATANTADAAACLSRAAACRACLALGSADVLSADCDAVDDGLANDSCSGG